MDKKFIKKIISIVFILFIIIVSSYQPVYAAINQQYTSDGIKVDTSDDEGIGASIVKFIQDVILGLIGKAIVGLAWCVEVLIRGVVALLTFDNGNGAAFPWADRVIFNGMPLLDVNFINPSPSSLFLKSDGVTYTGIGEAVRNIYFSGVSIALGFLGIVVAVMAIRLAISSIASEKAKYKEAIAHWATALVLIFGMHYVISFTFYINEQLVEVASRIVLDQTTQQESKIQNFFVNIGIKDEAPPVELLGTYFRTVAVEEWNTQGFTSAILYAIFIVQSLMFFYAYIKRFFYVVILAIISPFVVIYDFLTKAIS